LKAALNKAKDWGYIKENYLTKVKLPKRQKLAPGFVDGDQLSVICGHLINETMKDIIPFAFYTGLRLDEIVNLKWKNVDMQNRIITVGDDNFITKGRKQRFIPICGEVLETLLRIKNAECRVQDEKGNIKIRLIELVRDASTTLSIKKEFVFCKKNGEKFTGNYFSKQFKKACKAAGMDQSIHFHSLRHYFASNLVQKGVPLYTIKELLGHSSISTTEIYSHLNMDSLREAVKKLDTGCNMLDTGEIHKDGLKIYKINSGEEK
jgi:site-specific recombinase XerD